MSFPWATRKKTSEAQTGSPAGGLFFPTREHATVGEVVLAEVTLTDNEQFGVEWGLQDALMFDRSLLGPTVNQTTTTTAGATTTTSLSMSCLIAGSSTRRPARRLW